MSAQTTAALNKMRHSTKPEDFFQLWVAVCKSREEELWTDWDKRALFTSHALDAPNSLIKTIAAHLGFVPYCGYYSIDAILFKEEDDYVPHRPPGQTWVHRIRIAFEHENDFNSGLFQEFSHLLITDCELRVVVSYPGGQEELEREQKVLDEMLRRSDRREQIATSRGLLFIVGSKEEKPAIRWEAYLYEAGGWRPLPKPSPLFGIDGPTLADQLQQLEKAVAELPAGERQEFFRGLTVGVSLAEGRNDSDILQVKAWSDRLLANGPSEE